MDRLVFLGNGDSMGVPRVYCDCGVCAEARSSRINRRWRSCAAVQSAGQWLFIDGGPDWKAQMEYLNLKDLRGMIVTHAHHDHIGGLPEWADACRWLSAKATLFAPEEVVHTIVTRFPWLHRHLQLEPNDEGCVWRDWRIQPWRVNHGKNGHSYAYLFEKPGYRWAYCSDAIGLTDEQKKPMFGLDLLILGTSFYREEYAYVTRSVYDVVEALNLIQELRPARVIFTHLSHDIDFRKNYVLAANAEFARLGLEVPLG